jgi:ADP-ribose pyrophosphatase
MTRLVSFLALPGLTDERMEAFVATGLEEVGQSLERDEDIEVVVHSVEELDALMRDGTIEDGKTLATLLYYLRYGRHLPQ